MDHEVPSPPFAPHTADELSLSSELAGGWYTPALVAATRGEPGALQLLPDIVQ